MNVKVVKRICLLLALSSLLGACNETLVISSNNDNKSSNIENVSSETINSSTTTNTTISSIPSSISSIVSSQNSDPVSTLSNNTTTCSNHVLTEKVIKEATIIEKGIKRFECANCGGYEDKFFYDLDEISFEDKTFMYDGNERELLMEGLLPYGCRVQYENNKIKDIGQKEATMKVIDENEEVILTKTAKISIVENIGLPNVKIDTTTGEDPDWKEKEEYTTMKLSVDNCDPAFIKSKIPGGLRVRGNSTNQQSVTKRAWRIKLDGKSNLLGLNNGQKYKSWVLLADFFDSSMFRNACAFTMGNSLFNYSGNYCSDRQHVNLYLNGDYRGVYLLAEQQQAKDGRIPIFESEVDDMYDGTDVGYLLEIDGLVTTGQSDEQYTFTTGSGNGGGMGFPGWGFGGGDQVNGVNITDKGYAIKTDIYGDKQFPFIKNYINNVLTIFKNACKGEKLQVLDEENNIIDSPYSTMYETLNSIIDIDSLFRMYVLQEFMKNYDCGWGSFYLYVDFSNKTTTNRLTMGAPWDFDLGEGNKTNGNGVKTDDDFLNGKYTGMTEFNPWLYLLSQTDFFKDMFKKYYSVFANSDVYENMMDYIEYERVAFANDFNNTYDRWDLPKATVSGMSTRRYNTHKEASDYLINWYTNRKSALDKKYL